MGDAGLVATKQLPSNRKRHANDCDCEGFTQAPLGCPLHYSDPETHTNQSANEKLAGQTPVPVRVAELSDKARMASLHSAMKRSRPSLINSGKPGAVRKDHRTRIGSVQWKSCDPTLLAIDPVFRRRRFSFRTICAILRAFRKAAGGATEKSSSISSPAGNYGQRRSVSKALPSTSTRASSTTAMKPTANGSCRA